MQTLRELPDKTTSIINSPYAADRNSKYGWNALFSVPPTFTAKVDSLPTLHVGTSSLNPVPGKNRTFSSLFTLYKKKFSCLEHCYPYHQIGTKESWLKWKENISPNAGSCEALKLETRRSYPSSCFIHGDAPPENLTTYIVDPQRFQFTIKANKFLTHEKKLQCNEAEVKEHVHYFFNELCPLLDPFLGPILIQLPPSFEKTNETMERLSHFHSLLPKDELVLMWDVSGEKKNERDEGTASDSPSRSGCYDWHRRHRIRVAVEFRHPSWCVSEVFELCRSYGWAIVVTDLNESATHAGSASNPFSLPVSIAGADFMYVRLHGSLGRCVGDYGPIEMKKWCSTALHFLQQEMKSASSAGAPYESSSPPKKAKNLKEVFFFFNNNDSHVGGVTSSVADACCFADCAREALKDRGKPTNAVKDSILNENIDRKRERSNEGVHSVSSSSLSSISVISD